MRRFSPLVLLLATASCAVFNQSGGGGNQPYVVFFAEKSATLEQSAASVIAQAAANAATRPDAQVAVLGWTDSGGLPQADIVLSQQRAQQVAAQLERDGVAANRIVQQGRGQTHRDPGVESRRVEIRIGS